MKETTDWAGVLKPSAGSAGDAREGFTLAPCLAEQEAGPLLLPWSQNDPTVGNSTIKEVNEIF